MERPAINSNKAYTTTISNGAITPIKRYWFAVVVVMLTTLAFAGGEADANATHVIVVEGEKDADRVKEALRFKKREGVRWAVTTCPGGAKGWRPEFAPYSAGKCVVAEVLVKQLTGGDKVTARFLYSEFFEFDSQFKVFLSTNHKPVIRGTDNAIWRRIRLIPFEVTIPEEQQDKELAQKLRAEMPGILAWAVRGCLRWQEYGLGQPEKVSAATEAYREEMDVLGGFLQDCCTVGETCRVPNGQLYPAYKRWCESTGEKPLTRQKLATALADRGFPRYRTGSVRGRLGLELRDTNDGGDTSLG